MLSRAERLARGGIVGGFATATAAVSHALAGGYSPNALSLGAGVLFAGMLATFAIGRRPSLPRLAIVVAAGQLAFHLLFSLLGAGSAAAAPAQMSMADMAPVRVDPAAPVLGGAAHLLDPGMWVAHAIAAVLTIAFLRRVEQAVWRLLHDALLLVVRALQITAVPAASPRPVVPAVRPPATRVLDPALPLRGPPVSLSF